MEKIARKTPAATKPACEPESKRGICARLDLNLVGKNISKLRHQRGWALEELVAKLQLLGCNITFRNLTRIESLRCIVTDAQIAFFWFFDVGNG